MGSNPISITIYLTTITIINGFEEITAPISKLEQEMIPVIISTIISKDGNAITNREIMSVLRENGQKTNSPRIRAMLHSIRSQNLLPGIIATSKGYYLTTDPDKLLTYQESLEQRIASINQIVKVTKAYLQSLQ